MNFATGKVEEGKEKQFKNMLEEMSRSEKWTLRSWKQTIEKQLSSWMLYIPGMSNTNEVKSIQNFKSECLLFIHSKIFNVTLTKNIVLFSYLV